MVREHILIKSWWAWSTPWHPVSAFPPQENAIWIHKQTKHWASSPTSATVLRIPSITFSKSTRLKSGCCLSLWSSAANVSSWCFSMDPALDTLTQVKDWPVSTQIQNHVSTELLPALEGFWLWFSNIWTDSPTKRIFSATRTGMYEGSISTRRENCCRDGASMFSSSISLYRGTNQENSSSSTKYCI